MNKEQIFKGTSVLCICGKGFSLSCVKEHVNAEACFKKELK